MLITRKSTLTGIERTKDLNITSEQIANYESGQFIQNAMSNLSADEREFYLTGITGEEWDSHFKEK